MTEAQSASCTSATAQAPGSDAVEGDAHQQNGQRSVLPRSDTACDTPHCGAKDDSFGVPADLKDVPLVFIHGMKGCTLEDKDSRKLAWLSGSMAVSSSFSPISLALPLNVTDGVQDWRQQKRRLYKFVYDWRRSLNESADRFLVFATALAEKFGTRIQLVCHSMGGYLGLMAVNERPELFHSVLFAGTPFRPNAPRWVEQVAMGCPLGWNDEILTARVNFSFTSGYTFLPPNGEGLVDRDGNPIKLNYYDVRTWEEHKLGPFHPRHTWSVHRMSPDEKRKTVEFLEFALAEGKRARDRIQHRPDVQYPPMANISSAAHPTPCTIVKDGRCAIRGFDYESGGMKRGDTLVDLAGTLLPDGYMFTQYMTHREHKTLLSDTANVRNALTDLHRRAKGVESLARVIMKGSEIIYKSKATNGGSGLLLSSKSNACKPAIAHHGDHKEIVKHSLPPVNVPHGASVFVIGPPSSP